MSGDAVLELWRLQGWLGGLLGAMGSFFAGRDDMRTSMHCERTQFSGSCYVWIW